MHVYAWGYSSCTCMNVGTKVYFCQFFFTAVNCGDPGYLENGERNQEVFTFGQQLIFSCNYGYTMQGYEGSICMANGLWSSPLPVCQRK